MFAVDMYEQCDIIPLKNKKYMIMIIKCETLTTLWCDDLYYRLKRYNIYLRSTLVVQQPENNIHYSVHVNSFENRHIMLL